MNLMNKILVHFSAAAALALSVAPNVHAQKSPQQQAVKKPVTVADAISMMAEGGYKDFVLTDKRSSKLYLIENGKPLLETDIIYGRGQGKKSLTPSGVFSLTNLFQGEAQSKMAFHYDARVVYLVHGVVAGREAALLSDKIADRKLSEGCLNVPDVALPYVLGFARAKAIANPDQDATPILIIDNGMSSVKLRSQITSFKPEKYNPN